MTRVNGSHIIYVAKPRFGFINGPSIVNLCGKSFSLVHYVDAVVDLCD
jgi:hypothetical protein